MQERNGVALALTLPLAPTLTLALILALILALATLCPVNNSLGNFVLVLPNIINHASMGNLFLLFTILAESAAVLCMKLSNGFQNKLFTISAILLYGLSFCALTITLKYLPAGIANGVWAAASTLLVAILSYFIFNEKLSLIQIASLLLIVVGLVGLGLDTLKR